MGRPFAPELRERVMAAVAEKVPYRKIAADLRVSRQTVQNWVNRARAQAAAGAPLPTPTPHGQGGRREALVKLTRVHKEQIAQALLATRLTLPELVPWLRANVDPRFPVVGETALRNAAHAMGLKVRKERHVDPRAQKSEPFRAPHGGTRCVGSTGIRCAFWYSRHRV